MVGFSQALEMSSSISDLGFGFGEGWTAESLVVIPAKLVMWREDVFADSFICFDAYLDALRHCEMNMRKVLSSAQFDL